MNRVKDPQITILGLVKSASKDKSRKLIVVQLPPVLQLASSSLLEKTLVVNVPGNDYDRKSINAYLKHRLFDPNASRDLSDEACNRNDPQVLIQAIIKPSRNNNDHRLLIVELPSDGMIQNTLIINCPSNTDNDDEADTEVLCYLKYRVISDRYDRRGDDEGAGSGENTTD